MKRIPLNNPPAPAGAAAPITITFSCDRELNAWLETRARDYQLPKGAVVRLYLIERRSADGPTRRWPSEGFAEAAVITVAEARRRAAKGGAL